MAVHADAFVRLVDSVTRVNGMPTVRRAYVPTPVAGKSAAELRSDISGLDPVTERPFVSELVDGLTRPLSDDDLTGVSFERSMPRLLAPADDATLQQLFLDPSDTLRLWFSDYRPARRSFRGFQIRRVQSDADFLAWGWRVPFLLSAVLIGVGWWIRSRVDESPTFQAIAAEEEKLEKAPALEAIKRRPRQLIIGGGLKFAENISYYIVSVFSITYVTQAVGLSRQVALNAILIASSRSIGFYGGAIALAIVAPQVAAFGYLAIAVVGVLRARGDETAPPEPA